MSRRAQVRVIALVSAVAMGCALGLVPGAARAVADPVRPLNWSDGKLRVSSHAPFVSFDCDVCHDEKAPEPGRVSYPGDSGCFLCHEELKKHAHAFKKCTQCHNPHDATRKNLLRASLDTCTDCHAF